MTYIHVTEWMGGSQCSSYASTPGSELECAVEHYPAVAQTITISDTQPDLPSADAAVMATGCKQCIRDSLCPSHNTKWMGTSGSGVARGGAFGA